MFKSIVGLGFSKWWKFKKDIPKIIENYIKNWADEFFCWYTPLYWAEKFGYEVSPNGRFAEHEQITDFESLQEIVKEVHKHWKEIMGNINAWYYTDVTEKYIKKIIEDFILACIDWFICGSIGILEYLNEIADRKWEKWYIINWKKYKINISTILAVYNTEAIRFLVENYPINKIILSREITLKEIKQLAEAFPNLKFEVFGEWDFCRYNNWLCFAEHKYTNRDICTVVVNNWIIKKTFRYDFRKIIRSDIDNNKKVKELDNSYINEFQQLKEMLYENLENISKEKVKEILDKIINKHILYYDPLQGPKSKHNQNITAVYKAILFVDSPEYNQMKDYLEKEISLWKQSYKKLLQELVWDKFWVLAKLKDNFYNRADNLNLYNYLYFSKIPNIETVKFPTRWRDYQKKLNLIKETIQKNWENILDNLDLTCSFQRAHYELSEVFNWNKKRFYDIRKQLHQFL